MKCEKPGCRSPALRGDKRCYFHSEDPEIVQKRAEARLRGGKNSQRSASSRKPVETLQDVQAVLSEALNELRGRGGEKSIAKARAIAYVCGHMLKALELTEIEARITELEKKQADKKLLPEVGR